MKSGASPAFPRVGSAVLLVDQDRVLLGQRAKDPYRGRWVLPGGGVRPFESIEEAAKREAEEETGLLVRIEDRLGIYEVIVPPDEHRIIVYSLARPIGGSLRASSDLSSLGYFTRDELFDLEVTPLVRRVLVDVGWLRPLHVADVGSPSV